MLDIPVYPEQFLQSCQSNPTQTLTEFVDDFYAKHNVCVGRVTIHRSFKKHQITQKNDAKIAIEAAEEGKASFLRRYDAIICDPEKSVWLDETFRNDKTANPTHCRG